MLSFIQACEALALTLPRCVAKDQIAHAITLVYASDIDMLLRTSWRGLPRVITATVDAPNQRRRFTLKLIDALQEQAEFLLKERGDEWDIVDRINERQLAIVTGVWDRLPVSPGMELVESGKVRP